VREKAEGVCVMWLAHTSGIVRASAMEVLRAFSHPVFVALEDSRLPSLARLAAYLPAEDDSSSAIWSPHLTTILSVAPPDPHRFGVLSRNTPSLGAIAEGDEGADSRLLSDQFRNALQYAWVQLVERFTSALEVLRDLNSEKIGLWLNYAKFLCLAIPYPADTHGPPPPK
jgi:hypothetical protein